VTESNIKVTLAQPPRSMCLEGTINGERVWSRRHWVDHEFALSATSRQRKLAQTIEGSVSPTSWSFGAWTEIMRLLGDHLRYEPATPDQKASAPRDKKETERAYSTDDFFTNDYRLSSHRPMGLFHHEDERILGLQRLLLDYFGIETEDDLSQADEDNSHNEEEAVDRPEVLRPDAKQGMVRRKRQQELTEAEQKRARRITTRLIDQLLQERFLRHRHQDLLANDLTIVSVLLIAGWNEHWLSPELFFDLTYNVWTRLFFDHGLPDSEEDDAKGWLQLRSERAESPEAFRQSVGVVPLSAALAMWVFTCPDTASKPEKARFALATRMAVARLPWVWNLHRIDEVAEEIDRIASRTGVLKDNTVRSWRDISCLWNRMLGEGRALARFEQILAEQSLQNWRSSVEATEIQSGTLLWQGRLGFGVTKQDADCRSDNAPGVPTLLLRTEQREANIKPSYMLPVRQLLRTVSPDGRRFTDCDAQSLDAFLGQIEDLMSDSTPK